MKRLLHSALLFYTVIAVPAFVIANVAPSVPFMPTPPTISIAATSEVSTSDAEDGSAGNERPVAIGEVITYRLVMGLPESTTISFAVNDVLAAGLEYVVGSARVSYVANTLPSMNGNFAGIQNEMTPSFTFPASRISFNGGTRTLRFDFGSIINNDGDADEELVIIEFDVVVIDDPVNSNGQIWANAFSLLLDEGLPTEVITSSEEVSVIITELEQTIKIIKAAQPADDTPFSFSNVTTGAFMLRTPSAPMQTFTDLDSDSYTFTETAVSGWRVKDVTFSGDADNGSSKDIANRTFTVDLDAGEDVTVTVYNCQFPTFEGVSVSTVCVGEQATVTLIGLNPNTSLDITYTIDNNDPQTLTLPANANGVATFQTAALTANDNGLAVTITQIDFADDANSCVNDNLTNNSVDLVVNSITAGTITGSQTICITKDPAPFTTATPAMSNGDITYQWESSITGCDGTFSPIANATAESFDPAPGQFPVTTYFRRRAISTINGVNCEALSNCVTLTVLHVDCGSFPWSGNQ